LSRFQALDECLIRMRKLGYKPNLIVDCGANQGQFYRVVENVFPEARCHLIEPQPSCHAALRDIVATHPGRLEFHAVAVTEPAVNSLRMVGCGTTGAYVAKEGEPAEIEVPATSLDLLLGAQIQSADRTLLKLDLESHELNALRGAVSTLRLVESVLVEVAFYDIENWGRSTFADIFGFMQQANFELYDIASLSSRPRDERLRMGDVIFVSRNSTLLSDWSWA